MDETKVAWLAGLVEGEGTFTTNGHCWMLAVQMTDLDVLQRCLDWTGVGTLNGPYQGPGNRKPCWRWVVARRADLAPLVEALLPYLLGRRRARAEELLTSLATTDVGGERSRRARRLEAEIRQHRFEGLSQHAIARIVGCSRSRVQQVVGQ